ncbi:MAG TPA: putative N-acetylmannosamine-6-phosphate 2-epimerase [Gryllotalpicola sp.]
MTVLESLRDGLVVSSQVMNAASPLSDPGILSRMAKAAELGGAAGFRVDGPQVVADLRSRTVLPIIGIKKNRLPGADVYITTSIADALDLVDAGADIVAAQATTGARPHDSFAEIVAAVHRRGALVMADIATFDEGVAALADGADLVATTMAGFTTGTAGTKRPAVELARALCAITEAPVVVEGGIWSGEDVAAAFRAGAATVVVGSAVTAPDLITAHLIATAKKHLAS